MDGMNLKSYLLIFDLDGTLIDSRADLAEGINHMRAHYGLDPLPVEVIGGYVGDGVRKLVERSLQDPDVDLDEALEINEQYYRENLTVHTTLYPGVAEGLQRLKNAGHQLAVLTNKPGDPSREILKHFALDHLFAAIIGGGDIAQLKPEPEGIFRCAELAGVPLERVWMVGDHYTDLSVARNAGVKSAFVCYGFGEERGFKPDHYFASFAELSQFFTG
ncbi:MAG: HAD-IA family hydrolase [Pontiellaceae bacterium]|nr:HAD-IA family hydrolase [Pontiellaceae bacterium]